MLNSKDVNTDNSLSFIKHTLQDINKEIYKIESNDPKVLKLNKIVARASYLVDQIIKDQDK
jgi:hypothetical protein